MSKYHSVIFDLGKVIFDLSFDRVFQFWAATSGNQLSDIKNKFQFDDLLDGFERNEITARQLRTEISRRLSLKLSDEDFDKS